MRESICRENVIDQHTHIHALWAHGAYTVLNVTCTCFMSPLAALRTLVLPSLLSLCVCACMQEKEGGRGRDTQQQIKCA